MQVSYEWFILAPLLGPLILLLAAYLFYRWYHPLPKPAPKAKIYRCVVCQYVYIDQRNVPLSRCGRCGCLNEAIKR